MLERFHVKSQTKRSSYSCWNKMDMKKGMEMEMKLDMKMDMETGIEMEYGIW